MGTSHSHQPLDAQTEALGRVIRAARRASGLTLVAVAGRAELSHPFLSQLERGLVRPSMSSLFRIAAALGTSQQRLLAQAAGTGTGDGASASDDAPSTSPAHRGEVVRAGDGPSAGMGDGTTSGRARLLVAGDKPFFPMEYASTATTFDDFFTHHGDEFVFVIAGAMEVDLGGEERYHLDAGDSVFYPGGTPHRWRAIDHTGYRVLAVQSAVHTTTT